MVEKIRVADYVVKFLEQRGITHAFTVTGGGAMFLNDAFAHSTKIKSIFNHHEQASAMAAVGYSKVNNDVAIVVPTTGCGGTNTITGVLDAWQDSNKVMIISGNVNKSETTKWSGKKLRKFGVQEANIVDIVAPITKYSVMVTSADMIAYHLEMAYNLCTSGRPGPVWIDIPLDIQGEFIDIETLYHYDSNTGKTYAPSYDEFKKYLSNAKRPIIVAGYGIYLSNTKKEFIDFIEKYQIPVVTTYLGIDFLPSDHPLFIGRLGTKGDRAGNFAIQNSDLVISLGSSLSVSVTGFKYDLFARDAKKIVVDIDPNEHKNKTIKIDYSIITDLKHFFKNMPNLSYSYNSTWNEKCLSWKNKWPVFNEEYKNTDNGINIYYFIEKLSKLNKDDAIVISDAGSAYYATSQALKIQKNQRYITSGAQADMGFTIPAAIGASFASNSKNIIGITGDGSFQMNIQELQTIINFDLPIKIFILNNGGYLSIRNTIDKFFNGRYFGTDQNSGLGLPNIEKISKAYGFDYYKLETAKDLEEGLLENILNLEKAIIIEVICPYKQEIIPSSSTKKNDDGKLISQPLENMYPFLSVDEYYSEMIVTPVI